MGVCVLLLTCRTESWLNISDCSVFSFTMHFRVDQCFYLIFNAKNTALNKTHSGRSMLRAISETVGNSILIPSQHLFNNFQ